VSLLSGNVGVVAGAARSSAISIESVVVATAGAVTPFDAVIVTKPLFEPGPKL
jgi:hypothetical protein